MANSTEAKTKDPIPFIVVSIHNELSPITDQMYKAYISESSYTEYIGLFMKTVQYLSEEIDGYNNTDYYQLNDWIVELQWLLEDPLHDSIDYIKAQMYSFPQLISSYLAYIKLRQNDDAVLWLDNRNFIYANDNYSRPLIFESESLHALNQLIKGNVYIMQSNLATTDDNNSSYIPKKEILSLLRKVES